MFSMQTLYYQQAKSQELNTNMRAKEFIRENDSEQASPIGSIKPSKKKVAAKKNIEALA